MDNVVYLGEDFVAGVSDSFGATVHRHPMLEIYAACDGESNMLVDGATLQGSMLLIGVDAQHTIVDCGKRGLAVFLDPLHPLGIALRAKYLADSSYAVLDCPAVAADLARLEGDVGEDDVLRASEAVLRALALEPVEASFSEPVLRAIELLQGEDGLFDMDELAAQVCLSKSRLAHLFSEQAGITLKEYIQLKRLESACRAMVRGKSITQAAADTGFSSSSHIASSSRKLTGMQLRRLLNL